MGEQKWLRNKLLLNDHKLLFYFRNIMLTFYFLNLIPIFLIISIVFNNYGLDIIFSIIIFLAYVCVHLKFYMKYRSYFDFD